MFRKMITACTLMLALSANASAFCWDNTDDLIVKLKRVQLNTEQLKDVFSYQQSHRDLIASSHQDGRGCQHHEAMEVEFQKKSIGVLNDDQFKKFTGRERTETESLRFENHKLQKELARLRQELALLKKELAALER